MSMFVITAMLVLLCSRIGYVDAAASIDHVSEARSAAERKAVEADIEDEDPFCLIFAVPPECESLIAPFRTKSSADNPLLRTTIKWITCVARKLMMGRIVLFEGGWKCLANRCIEGLEDLAGYADNVGETFDWFGIDTS